MASFDYNPITGQLDLVGSGGASYIDGDVEFHSNLPVTVGTPAVNSAFLVRKGEGLYFISRKPAGIWVRELNNGNLDDWKFAGLFSDLYRDANFRIISDSDVSKELAFSLSGISTGTTRTLTVPNASGRIALSNYAVVTTAQTLAAGSVVAADTTAGAFTLTLPASPANGDTVSILDYASTFDTNNLTIARNGSNIESLAENMDCNLEDAAFSLVYVGSTVGWKVVPYFGAKTNLASAGPIGSTIPSTGAFTTLTASTLTATPNAGSTALTLTGGTVTASAPLLDATQAWNNSGVTFTGLAATITNTASATGSLAARLTVGSTNVFEVDARGFTTLRKVATTTDFVNVFIVRRGTTEVFAVRDDGVINATAFSAPAGGAGQSVANADGFGVRSSGSFRISSDSAAFSPDVYLRRDAAGVFAQYNAANPQAYRLYSTYTSATSFERLNIAAQTGGSFIIGTEKGSAGGTARGMELRTDNVARINISATGGIGFFGAAAAAQPTAVADATDAASVITQLNALLARMRTLGLIAT